MKNTVNIGLFGFGVVGEGLFQLIENNRIAKTEISKVCVRQKDKKRSVDRALFTIDPGEIINDASIGLVVELIDDDEKAYEIVKDALLKGKSVVTGNKKMLARHLNEFIEMQENSPTALLYDASTCGSIPVIRNLEEYYDNDLLKSITGILNGSSNYILTRIFEGNTDYDTALKEAQEQGYAESDPSSDVEGLDSLYKLIIIACHGFGTYVTPERIFTFGISGLSNYDIDYAKEKNCKVKLVARVERVGNSILTMYVMPRFVRPDEYIYNVDEANNGVIIEGECYGKQFLFGKGAGAFPTASSVFSDITASSYNYRYKYKKRHYFSMLNYTTDTHLEIYLRYRDSGVLKYFAFESISERYNSSEFNYIIGKIRLSDLLNAKGKIAQKDIFIADIGQ
jgi:homoserine dehydrogenase